LSASALAVRGGGAAVLTPEVSSITAKAADAVAARDNRARRQEWVMAGI
jgi:hypothetical protein